MLTLHPVLIQKQMLLPISAKRKKIQLIKRFNNSKKEMKAAVKAFRKSVMKKGDKKKAESIHYSMEPQLSYSLIDQKQARLKSSRRTRTKAGRSRLKPRNICKAAARFNI